MNLALFAIKLQLALLTVLFLALLGLAWYTGADALFLSGSQLIDLIITVILFNFIHKEHRWAAVIYVVFTVISYFKFISSNFDVFSIIPFANAVLSMVATYGLFTWWRNERVKS